MCIRVINFSIRFGTFPDSGIFCFYFNTNFKCWPWVMIMIIWYLDLQQPLQSVPIATEVVRLNPAHERCTGYNIM
jgi:hypothetical protein